MSRKCPICGKPIQGFYKYCAECNDKIKNGEIVQCEKCGTWHDPKLPCPKCAIKKPEEHHTHSISDSGKCILCGKPTFNGNHFCIECYKKYSKKTICVIIKNCTDAEVQDEAYEGKISCDDGHIAKSKSEKMIDDYFFSHGIPHVYESSVSIDDSERDDIHPDFFLPHYLGSGNDDGVYLEHFGYEQGGEKYENINKYKIEHYKKQGLTVICTYESDMNNLAANLARKLKSVKKGQLNFYKEK
jgi:hypothetical protein